MTQEDKKRAAAEAALEHVRDGQVVGVGTGSTTNYFIDALARRAGRIGGAVASSEASARRLAQHGIAVLGLDAVESLPLYVDGADEVTPRGEMVKGGGGALTREKVVAFASRRFVCIVDDGKLVAALGAFPLPVEVVPMAVPVVARELRALGGDPRLREGFETDNGNHILDLHGWGGGDPLTLEETLDHIPGVVTNGLFCRRGADLVIAAGEAGVRRIECGAAGER